MNSLFSTTSFIQYGTPKIAPWYMSSSVPSTTDKQIRNYHCLPLFINIILLAKCHYSSLDIGADAATSAEIQGPQHSIKGKYLIKVQKEDNPAISPCPNRCSGDRQQCPSWSR